MITQDFLKEILDYSPITGVFVWKFGKRPCKEAGSKTGVYVQIKIYGRPYQAHRLAYLFMTGKFPDFDVDHKDTNKKNNSWDNLRIATDSQNRANTGLTSANSSGFKGIHFHGGKWEAGIKVNGKRRYLGRFLKKEDAAAAYRSAAIAEFGEFARF